MTLLLWLRIHVIVTKGPVTRLQDGTSTPEQTVSISADQAAFRVYQKYLPLNPLISQVAMATGRYGSCEVLQTLTASHGSERMPRFDNLLRT
jgi:hypothetical protein